MNRLSKLGTLLLASGALSLTSHAQTLLQHWDFTSAAAGLNPTQVQGSVAGGPQFVAGGIGQLTNGSTLHVSPTGPLNSHVDIENVLLPAGHHTYRAEFVIGGWDFSVGAGAGETRRLSLGFAGIYGDSTSFLFAAGGSVRMNASGQILFTAEGSGTADQSNTTTVASGFTAVQTSPIYLRIDVNTKASTTEYVTIFSDQSDFSNVLFTFGGTTLASRTGPEDQLSKLRIGPLDGASSGVWNGDWVSVDSVSLYAIPEPSTYAAIFGGLALLGAFVYRRRGRK